MNRHRGHSLELRVQSRPEILSEMKFKQNITQWEHILSEIMLKLLIMKLLHEKYC